MTLRATACIRFAAIFAIFFAVSSVSLAQKDRGVRPGPPGAGTPIPGLKPNEQIMFDEGLQRAVQLEGVCDDCSDETLGSHTDVDQANLRTKTNSSGLGVRFNGDQCTACHNQPALGGSGGFMVPNPQDPPSKYRKPENPEYDLMAHRKGATNYVPSFIQQYGPIREVRFARKPNGTPDGGVHQLFTVVGRSDIFPATMFAAEAYNVEMGITNDIFTQATDESPNCTANKSEPNDITRMDDTDVRNQGFENPRHELPDWLMFGLFMRFLDAPQPVAFSTSAQRGQQLFGIDPHNPGVGCFTCHTPTMITPAQSETEALQNLTVHPYSDLLIHHMGKGLADDITQGLATGDMFRSTPLWGVGQRRFFLHDGRTDDLLQAIQAHHSAGSDCDYELRRADCYGPSEANTVIQRFNALSTEDKQAILDFLRSL